MRNLFLSISILCILVCLVSCSAVGNTDNNLSDAESANPVQEQIQSDQEENPMQAAGEPYTEDTRISDCLLYTSWNKEKHVTHDSVAE